MDWNIDMIEALPEKTARVMSIEDMQIKGHNVYFVDFGGYFKYSALVFAEGKHIHYANDYALHHQNKTCAELRDWYIETMNHKLFTEDEITGPIAHYDDYKAKEHYLRNYYGMRRDHVSAFFINPTQKQRNEFERITQDMIYDPVCFAYFDDREFVTHHRALFKTLQDRWAALQGDYDVMKAAFISEMWNHEYAINWQGDWDVLSAFWNIEYHDNYDLSDYFAQINHSDTLLRAFMDAKREYMKQANETYAE